LQAATSLHIFHNKYSYSSWSLKAQLLSSYSYYQKKFYSEAVITLESYIRLNDNNKYLPYAYFLQGICYYEQISYSLRDKKFMDLAEVTFKNLIKRFPQSFYSKAAYKKLDEIYTRMATHEIKVGCFYQKKYLWSAAINRFQGIIKNGNYKTTRKIPEVLYRLAESYSAIGMHKEAKKILKILKTNFPENKWLNTTYFR
jgi:outer membrane protein assembly factor BamD